MKAKGRFISTLLVIDTFLVSYAAGFNSRHVLIVDSSLPPLKPAVKAGTSPSPATASEKQKVEAAAGAKERTGAGQPAGKSAKKRRTPGKTSGEKTGKSEKKRHKNTKVSTDK